jgi:hypothetical protein
MSLFEEYVSQPLSRLRRNHALEHATMHVLSQHHQDLRMVGRSTPQGFILYGDLPTQDIVQAAREGMERLRRGESELAVHPSCGTNFVAAGLLSGVSVFAALTPRRRDWKEWLNRLPLAIVLATLGLMLGQRLGAKIQSRVTTDAEIGDARIAGVTREEHGSMVLHRVRIEG